MTLAMVPYMLALLILVVGLYAIVAKRNLIKVIVGLLILDYAANLFLVLVGEVGMKCPRGRLELTPRAIHDAFHHVAPSWPISAEATVAPTKRTISKPAAVKPTRSRSGARATRPACTRSLTLSQAVSSPMPRC